MLGLMGIIRFHGQLRKRKKKVRKIQWNKTGKYTIFFFFNKENVK